MGSRKVRAAFAVAMLMTAAAVATPARAAEPVVEDGYVTVSDGTKLRFHVERPPGDGPFPVILQYDGYSAGSAPDFGAQPELRDRLLAKGYAFAGVSIRGTGCSEGAFDLFEPQWWTDGAEVVEWLNARPWAGRGVGMYGYSYPGITQLGVAALRPPALKAIAPASIVWDLYRDVGYPGGIPNAAFASLFSFQQEQPSLSAVPEAGLGGDVPCLANHVVGRATYRPFALEALLSPFADGPFDYPRRSVGPTADRIEVPALTVDYWQDEQTGSRVGGLLEPGGILRTLDPSRTWALWSNGNHDLTPDNPAWLDLSERFFERFLGGKDNGFEQDTPHVQLDHEVRTSNNLPRWRQALATLPSPRPATLHLRAGGALLPGAPLIDEGAARYAAPLPSPGTDPLPFMPELQLDRLWRTPQAPVGRSVFTTPKLGRTVTLMGSASADLHVASTASETDLQVTLSEVRPDGQEVYVQRGWLRVSKRKLDPQRSTPTRPFYTFREADAQPVARGARVLARVEVFPFSHTFRAGSALRLIVDTPMGTTGDWGSLVHPEPGIVSISRSPAAPSKLVVGVLDDAGAVPASLPPCGELRNQPCRASVAPVPPGTLGGM